MAAVTPGTSIQLDRGPGLPSRMAAVQTPLPDSATSGTRIPTGFKPAYNGQLYNPRAQRTVGREQWREDVAESARKSGIPTSTLAELPPTMKSILDDNPKLDTKEVEAALAIALAEYQERNTTLWDVMSEEAAQWDEAQIVRICNEMLGTDLANTFCRVSV